MTTKAPCQAKNPATCPYHSAEAKIDTLKNKINSLFSNTPTVLAPELGSSKSKKFTGKIEITPVSKTAKSQYAKTIEADTYAELMDKLREESKNLDNAGLNEKLKAGYSVSITTPVTSSDPSITSTSTSYNTRDVNSMKEQFKKVANKNQAYNETCSTTINELKDTSLGQTPQGIKGVAVMETMAKFSFPSKSHANSDITAAWDSIVKNGTPEYTNRPYGIRLHPTYDRKGELTEAKFSLDGPHTIWSSFTPEQVDKANTELKEYFKEVNNRFSK